MENKGRVERQWVFQLKLCEIMPHILLSNGSFYFFSSILVAEWPPFGKQLLTRLTICSLKTCFPFWF